MTRDEWRIIFGDNLHDILTSYGMSQNQLAKESGLSIGTISDYVNKWTVPNIPAIINMAYSLDVNVEELTDFGDRIEMEAN